MNMKIVILIVLIVTILILGMVGFIFWMFPAQYNSKGVSHWLVITIDKNAPKEYIGKLDDYDIYVEKLNIDESNFRSIDAKNISIKDAIENNLVSIQDWRKYAWKIRKDGDTEILQNENYEIAITNDECIIRPITKSNARN